MYNSRIVFLLIFLTLFAKCKTKSSLYDSPLTTVIKLISAETFMDFYEAEKYINVDKVYAKYAQVKNTTPKEFWKDFVISSNRPNGSKKISNQLKYYNYEIIETITGENAEVKFKSKITTANIQSMVYKLVRNNHNWIVTEIVYSRLADDM